MEVNGSLELLCSQFLIISSFVFKQNKDMHTGLELLGVSKWDFTHGIFIFGWTIPLSVRACVWFIFHLGGSVVQMAYFDTQ